MPTSIKLVPVTQRDCHAFIKKVHRHLPRPPRGDLFRVGLEVNGKLVAVATAGRPVSRMIQNGSTAEITRVATRVNKRINACSRLYGALVRAGRALGYVRFITYTLKSEKGISPKAAGFFFDGITRGDEWSGKTRSRKHVKKLGEKKRFIWPARTSNLWDDLTQLEI